MKQQPQRVKKPEVAWAIKTDKILLPMSIRSTRRQCKEDAIESYNWGGGEIEVFSDLESNGYSCVKIYITEA